MATTQHTKDSDERLRKELEHADIGKFKEAMKRVLKNPHVPPKATSKNKKI